MLKNHLMPAVLFCLTLFFCSSSTSVIKSDDQEPHGKMDRDPTTPESGAASKDYGEACPCYSQPTDDSVKLMQASSVKDKIKDKLKDTAYLFISAEPSNATILLDGKYLGAGQAFWQGTGAKYRKVEVTSPGFERIHGFVELKEKEVVKFHFALKPEGGNLTILTEPAGAAITIDNVSYGKTPETVKDLKAGYHSVSLKSGAWSWSGDVEVKRGETTLISLIMGALKQPEPVKTDFKEKEIQKPAETVVVSPEAQNQPQEEVVQPVEKTEQQPSPSKGAKPDCVKICKKYSDIVEGSDTTRETINRQCVKRCETEADLRFAACAWRAKTMEDVVSCSQITVK